MIRIPPIKILTPPIKLPSLLAQKPDKPARPGSGKPTGKARHGHAGKARHGHARKARLRNPRKARSGERGADNRGAGADV